MKRLVGKALEKVGMPIAFKLLKKHYANDIHLVDRTETNDDWKNCTDIFIIKNNHKYYTGVRFRNPGEHNSQVFTIRSYARGYRCELDKIADGRGAQLYFYAIFKDYHYKSFLHWFLIDLSRCRTLGIIQKHSKNYHWNRESYILDENKVWKFDPKKATAYIELPIEELFKKRCILQHNFSYEWNDLFKNEFSKKEG